MRSLCECVVKRTGKVCAKPTTGFTSKGTPVCGMHTGRPRRRRIIVNTPVPPIKKEDPPPPPTTKQNHHLFLSMLSWIVVLTTLMLVNPPPQEDPTCSTWTQKMLECVFSN